MAPIGAPPWGVNRVGLTIRKSEADVVAGLPGCRLGATSAPSGVCVVPSPSADHDEVPIPGGGGVVPNPGCAEVAPSPGCVEAAPNPERAEVAPNPGWGGPALDSCLSHRTSTAPE